MTSNIRSDSFVYKFAETKIKIAQESAKNVSILKLDLLHKKTSKKVVSLCNLVCMLLSI